MQFLCVSLYASFSVAVFVSDFLFLYDIMVYKDEHKSIRRQGSVANVIGNFLATFIKLQSKTNGLFFRPTLYVRCVV